MHPPQFIGDADGRRCSVDARPRALVHNNPVTSWINNDNPDAGISNGCTYLKVALASPRPRPYSARRALTFLTLKIQNDPRPSDAFCGAGVRRPRHPQKTVRYSLPSTAYIPHGGAGRARVAPSIGELDK
ncbi:hypothetical protein ACJJTC_015344 [Scirpophaga incertulas]